MREAVKALNDNRLIESLEAVGLIDRDFRPDAVLASMGAGVIVLPVHEIEGLVWLPGVVERLGRHLGKVIPAADVTALIRSSVTDPMLHRCALERMRFRLLNLAQDVVLSKPAAWDAESLRAHASKLGSDLGDLQNPEVILDQELAMVSSVRDSGTVEEMVRMFPSKLLAAAVGVQLGMKTEKLFELMSSALLADP